MVWRPKSARPLRQYEHFIEWKRAESEDEPPAAGLEVAIRGIGAPERLLDLIENFVAYEKGKGGLIKKLAKNHQFLGVNRAVAAVDRIAETRGRLGVFWHTQGSGKSLSMLYFAQKVLRTKPGNWTFVIVTDRDELDDQIAETFAACGALTKERDEVQAQSREHLKTLLQGNERYVFTLIQKFGTAQGETFPKLSDRSDIIVITDEAHRSQYAVFAANMRRALPNAAFIALHRHAADRDGCRENQGGLRRLRLDLRLRRNRSRTARRFRSITRTASPSFSSPTRICPTTLTALIEEADLDEEQETRLAQVFSPPVPPHHPRRPARQDRRRRRAPLRRARLSRQGHVHRHRQGDGGAHVRQGARALERRDRAAAKPRSRRCPDEERRRSGGQDRLDEGDRHGRDRQRRPERKSRHGGQGARHRAPSAAHERRGHGGKVQGPGRSVPARLRVRHVAHRLRRAVVLDDLPRQADEEPHADADHRARQPGLRRQGGGPHRRLRRRVPQSATGARHLCARHRLGRDADQGQGRPPRRIGEGTQLRPRLRRGARRSIPPRLSKKKVLRG